MTGFRFIDTGAGEGAFNMGTDEALLRLANKPVLRVYRWIRPVLTVGRSERTWRNINLDYCRQNSIPIIRRITGGKSVLHHHELTYSLIFPRSKPHLPDSITESYFKIAGMLSDALASFGLRPSMQQRPAGNTRTFCFTSAGWYELLVGGKKICGSAQKRSGPKLLQHGAILLNFDADVNARLFNIPPSDIPLLNNKITCLSRETGREISHGALSQSLLSAFSTCFELEAESGSLTGEETKLAGSLAEMKYGHQSWNKIP